MEQTLGKRIVSNRKRMGLTQDQLAEKLGVTAQAVSKWENDQSCPDITMLPRLAEIFGISTDELLGIEPQPRETVHQAEVVAKEAAPENGRSDKGHWEFKYDAGRKGGIGMAVWVLLVGGLLLASNLLGWEAGLWDILWPSGLLVFGLFGLLPKFSFFRLGCTLFGGYFLLDNLGFTPFDIGKLLLPICILLFGLSLLVDALRKKKKPHFQVYHDGKPVHNGEKKHTTNLSQEGNTFHCSTCFGDDRHLIELAKLARGEADVSFGELTVDLSGCGELAENCRIDASCSFGQLNFLIPSRWRVEPACETAFASVDISGHPDPEPEGIIYMDCSVSFGSIEIEYI